MELTAEHVLSLMPWVHLCMKVLYTYRTKGAAAELHSTSMSFAFVLFGLFLFLRPPARLFV